MKYTISAALTAAFAVQQVAAHATWQDLWVDGVDYDTQCARQPVSNSPVTDVTSDDMACNAGTSAVSSNCPVTAGSTVTGMQLTNPRFSLHRVSDYLLYFFSSRDASATW